MTKGWRASPVIEFSRYPHVHDLITHYANKLGRTDINQIMVSGIRSNADAELFSRFIWEMVGQMNEDEASKVEVLGSIDNSDMIPDVSYEVTKLMRNGGYYPLWEKISSEEI